ncbi:MAG TPA: aspartate kinase [Acidobacteria bacterium]|nr:aspartate kinase [Acidobacteriota bacterium]
MAILVQKYGGTSLGDAAKIKSVAQRVARSREAGNEIAVVVSAMGKTTDALIALADSVSPAPEPREMDLLLSTGEVVSSTLMAMALREIGVPSISMGGAQAGIRTDAAHGRASIVHLDPARVRHELDGGTVVIIAGFQGINDEMDITTLGRGGSDTTGVALAIALEADRCEIYTDVDGIYTADPRVVPDAKKLAEIGYEEMLELATYGAKMHPRSIELAAWYKLPVLVASSTANVPGTLIHDITSDGGDAMEVSNKVRGVTYDRDVARVTIRGVLDSPGISARVFEPLTDAGISVDTIVQNASTERLTDLSFTVERRNVTQALEVTRRIATDIGAADCVAHDHLGNVSIVGTGMQNAPGFASRMFRALADAAINIEMITTSQIRITCLVDESQVDEAVRVLHDAFEVG